MHVSEFEKDTIYGCPVSIYTSVSSPYGDGTLIVSLQLPDDTSMLLLSKSERSVVDVKGVNLNELNKEDRSILISSAQHNLQLDEVRREVFKKLQTISKLFDRD